MPWLTIIGMVFVRVYDIEDEQGNKCMKSDGNMITEDYVSFEVAKLLKEKGFDEDIDLWYDENGEMFSRHKYDISGDWRVKAQQKVYECPTLQMTMKWLREVHKLHISVEMGFDVDYSQYFFYVPSVCRFSNKSGEYQTPFVEKEFGSYDEACNAVIKYCLENLS